MLRRVRSGTPQPRRRRQPNLFKIRKSRSMGSDDGLLLSPAAIAARVQLFDVTAAHGDEGFWREHASRLTDNNCALLRTLVALLRAGDAADAVTLAVACHDLGEFAAHYPAGRFLVSDLGGKASAMALLTHADPDVRKHALLCTQKLLVAKWQFRDRPGGGEVTA